MTEMLGKFRLRYEATVESVTRDLEMPAFLYRGLVWFGYRFYRAVDTEEGKQGFLVWKSEKNFAFIADEIPAPGSLRPDQPQLLMPMPLRVAV